MKSGQMRDYLEQLLIERGAIIQKQVTKKTDLVIAGQNPSPAKIAKAKELGIKIVYIE